MLLSAIFVGLASFRKRAMVAENVITRSIEMGVERLNLFQKFERCLRAGSHAHCRHEAWIIDKIAQPYHKCHFLCVHTRTKVLDFWSPHDANTHNTGIDGCIRLVAVVGI